MFTASVLKEIYDPNKSLVFSPIGLYRILSNILHGCNGETKKQLSNLLNSTCYSGYENKCPNSITDISAFVVKKCYNVYEDFTEDSTSIFKTQVFEFNNISQIPRIMDKWIRTESNYMIDYINCHIYENTKSLIANAVHLTTKYETFFSDAYKDTIKFVKYNGTVIHTNAIRTMPYYYPFTYLEDIKCSVIQLWKLGYSFSMFIIVPDDEKCLNSLIDNMSEDTIKMITSNYGYRRLELCIPTFSLTNEHNFSMPIFNLGCNNLFIDGDFSGISDTSDFQISGILQKSIINIDYNFSQTKTSKERECLRFTVDKPFMFIVTDAFENISMMPRIVGVYQGP
ncbi:serpin [Finch poxvirus]|uniref:Serpin n=1 Tax=Condorpox virus TaxID=3049970 RepID=A0AAT9UQH4_9POXV|nr:serpin [Finch poxvirus]UOX39044.1 serpin [Finch poxvirus]